MDLHACSAAVAKAVIRAALCHLRKGHLPPLGLYVTTGHGLYRRQWLEPKGAAAAGATKGGTPQRNKRGLVLQPWLGTLRITTTTAVAWNTANNYNRGGTARKPPGPVLRSLVARFVESGGGPHVTAIPDNPGGVLLARAGILPWLAHGGGFRGQGRPGGDCAVQAHKALYIKFSIFVLVELAWGNAGKRTGSRNHEKPT